MTPNSIGMSARELRYVIQIMVSVEREEPVERMESMNRDELFEIFTAFIVMDRGSKLLEKTLAIIQGQIEKLQDSLSEKNNSSKL